MNIKINTVKQIIANTIKIPKTIKNITYYPPSPAAGHGLHHHKFHDIW